MNDYWCIPSKEDAEFVACMEDVLDVYELPYNPMRPVVCMDEKPYQLLDDVRKPLPMRPGDNQKIDSEYKRNGTCSIFAFVEPLGGKHHVSVHEHRTAIDWAMEIKHLSDEMFQDSEKIILGMDNLNTHKTASLYKAFPLAEARRIDTIDRLKSELSVWEMEHNQDTAKIQWHFQTGDAREKLISLYPVI